MKKILFLILVALLLFACEPLDERGRITITTNEGHDLEYQLDLTSKTATVFYAGSESREKDLIIPSTIKWNNRDFLVTTIGESAFISEAELTGNLKLPNSLKTIEFSAFARCSGFTGDLVLPNSLETIEDRAFQDCTGFTGLKLPNSLETIESYTFHGCSGFTGKLELPDSLKTIGVSAFAGCSGFTSLKLSNSLETIENYAFQGCSGFTGEISFPASVTKLGEYIFTKCTMWTTLTVHADNQNYYSEGNVLYSKDKTKAIMAPEGFDGDITLLDSVTAIESVAFRDVKSLENIIIGELVEKIGYGAFLGCTGLLSITSKAVVPPEISYPRVFEGVPSDIPIYVPEASLEAYKADSRWGDFTNYQSL